MNEAITLGNVEIGQTLLTVLNLSCSGRIQNGLSNGSLITIFPAILFGLQTLYYDKGRQHKI